jgi:hypothetical protein
MPSTEIVENKVRFANAPRKTRNSLTKPASPGRPSDANAVNKSSPPYTGTCAPNPPNSLRSRVCVRSYNMPTKKNKPPVITP